MTRSSLPRRFPRRSALAAACLLASVPAFAAEPAAEAVDRDVTTLDQLTIKGERSSYTVQKTRAGTRMELEPREIPQAVSVITLERIQDQNLQNIGDVLNNVTGVAFNQIDSERTSFFSRGFYIDSYLFDGVPTQMVQNWSYGDSALDLAIYERVEVVHGATGLLTGAGNPSASVNLVRKHADSKELTGSVSVGAGSWGKVRTTVDVTTPLNASGSVRARVIGNYSDTDSWMDRYSVKKNLGYAVIDADLGEHTLLSVGYEYQKKESDGVTWGGFPLWDYATGERTHQSTSFNPAPDWTYWDTTTKKAFAGLQHEFGNGWNFKINASHEDTDADDVLFYVYNGGGTIVPYTGKYLTNRKVDGVDGYIAGPFQLFGREHQFTAGLSYNRRKYDNDYAKQLSWDTPTVDYTAWTGEYPQPVWGEWLDSSSGTITQKAAYAAARFSLADPLSLIVGARYTDWRSEGEGDDRTHKVTTPYAGLVYDINATWSAYASYTDIFQPQTYRNVNGSYLDPVTGKQYEVGVKSAWFDNRLNASLSLFRIEQENTGQVTDQHVIGQDEEYAYIAAKGVVSKGVEFELSGELATGWNATFGASRYIARDASDKAINPTIPTTALKLFTSYTPQGEWNALTVGGGVNWQNATYYVDSTFGRFEQGSYALVNLFARYRIAPQFAVQVNLNNLLDRTYYSKITSGSGAWGAPRNGELTFTWSF